MKKLILDTKSINLYGYTIIAYVAVCAVGFAIAAISEDFKPGVVTTILITLLVPLLGYLFRFYRCRNHAKTRQKLEATESPEEISKLVLGGPASGLMTLVVMGITFYLALKTFVL